MANSLARNVASRRISFVSWNVRGLGKPTKLNKVLSHLDNLEAQIAFIQETHLNVSDHTKVLDDGSLSHFNLYLIVNPEVMLF